jgi:hypothetical protein
MTTAVRSTRAALVVATRCVDGQVELDALAHEAGLHPDLVARLVALGLLEPAAGLRNGRTVFPRDAASQLARAVRLRRDLGLNYAGAVLAGELLDRIQQLEQRLRCLDPPDAQRR